MLRNTDIAILVFFFVFVFFPLVWNHWTWQCARLKFRSVVCNVCVVLRTMVCQFLVLTVWMPTLPCQTIQWVGGEPRAGNWTNLTQGNQPPTSTLPT